MNILKYVLSIMLLAVFCMPFTSPYAAITTCAEVQSVSGQSVSGGTAGFTSDGEECFSGGGSNFCAGGPSFNHTFECAGSDYVGEGDILWPPFEPLPDFNPETAEEYYNFTTRDATRGRAGSSAPLFMNAHGVCRSVDNTAGTLGPLFMGVSTAEEWRTVHGVVPAGDPNGGYANYANNAALAVDMNVCCSPIVIRVCGVELSTGYANVGDVVAVASSNGGYAEYRCASNNNFVPQDVTGICDGSSDPSVGSGGGGYHNPSNGGTISDADWGNLDADQQSSLSGAGYGPTSSVDNTNAVGQADMDAVKAAEVADVDAQEAAAAAAQAAEEAAIAAAEQAAAEAEAAAEEAESDSDP